MSAGDVKLGIDGAVATITLERVERANTLTPTMLDRLAEIVAEVDNNTAVRVAIITGAGDRAFCGGADIDCWAGLAPIDMWRRWIRDGHRVFDQLGQLRQPLIAVINGAALGGGLELATTADLIIAEAHAKLGLPETGIGIIPGWAGTQRLVRQVGPRVVKRLALTGELVDAEAALRLGIVDETCAAGGGMAAAGRRAEQICGRSPVAVQLTKQLIGAASGEGQATAIEGFAAAVAAGSADCQEGVASFREKRAPRFVDQ